MKEGVKLLKTCEICGSTNKVKGKRGKFKKDLCQKHYGQMLHYGKIFNTMYDTNDIIQHDDYIEIVLKDKDLNITGKAKIDIEDLPKVSQKSWYLRSGGKGKRYVYSGVADKLSRFVMDADKDVEVIYKNKDTLDCRKKNLLFATKQQRMQNSKLSVKNKSGHKGVYWDSSCDKWAAAIKVNYKQIKLGRFDDINDAIAARKDAEKKYFGEYAYDPEKDVTVGDKNDN